MYFFFGSLVGIQVSVVYLKSEPAINSSEVVASKCPVVTSTEPALYLWPFSEFFVEQFLVSRVFAVSVASSVVFTFLSFKVFLESTAGFVCSEAIVSG